MDNPAPQTNAGEVSSQTEEQKMVNHAMYRFWRAYALRSAIRELEVRAFVQRDPKVREGIDLAIDHLNEILR